MEIRAEEKIPRFSIVTITRNHRAGLAATAASIQTQTCTDYEWIIIDGASTDGTQADFHNYTSAILISEPDAGIYDAMNKGLDLCTGDYVIFMNAGDQFADVLTLEMIADFTNTPPDFIYGDSLEGNHYKSARPYHTISQNMFTHHQAMIYNRAVLGDLRYNLDYKIAADYDLTLRFLKRAKRIVYIPAAICIFEQGGVSQRQAALGRHEQFLSRKRHMACGPLTNRAITLTQTMAWTLRSCASPLYWLLRKILR